MIEGAIGIRIMIGLAACTCILSAQSVEHPNLGPPTGTPPAAIISDKTPVPGDPVHGRTVVEGKGACLTCHTIGSKGSRLGLDLSDVGTRRSPDVLEQLLIAPSPAPQSKLYRVVTTDGKVITGKLYNQDIYSLQMMDSQERLVSLQKSQVKEQGFVPAPPMPSYQGKLTPEELTDVVAYLATLKGVVKQ